MSYIKNKILEQIESDSNVDLEFREIIAGFHSGFDRNDKTLEINRILDSMIESCTNAERYFSEAAESAKGWDFDRYSVEDDLERQAEWGNF